MPEEKKWGIGIEHEFRVSTDDAKKFKAAQSFVRGGRREYLTTSGRWIQDESESGGEKLIADVHEDMTVTPGYEVATRGFQQDTVEKSIKKLRDFESKILERHRIPAGDKRKAIFPFGIAVTESGKFHNEIRSDSNGPGSYHVSITFPHNTSNGTAYKEDMHKFLSNLQWLEPLIFGVTGGPSPESIDDRGRDPEGSVRTTRSEYHNAGGINPHDRELTSSSPASQGYGKYLNETIYPKYLETIRIREARNRMSKGDFMNRGVGKRMSEPGIEIRILDSFDSQGINPLVKFILYTAAQSKRKDLSPIAKNNGNWNEAMKQVMEEGHNAILPKEYLRELKTHLGLTTLDVDGDRRAESVMRVVEKELWQKNKNSEIAEKMIQDNRTQPRVYNFNRDGWNFLFKHKLRTSHNYKEGMDKFMESFVRLSSERNLTLPEFNTIINGIFGPGMATEDTSDIADLLEINGLAKINRNADGSIRDLKPLYTFSEAKDKCTALAKDAGFFEQESELYGIQDVDYSGRVELDTAPAGELGQGRPLEPSSNWGTIREVSGSNFAFRIGDAVRIRQGADVIGTLQAYQVNGTNGRIVALNTISNLARVEFSPGGIANTYDLTFRRLERVNPAQTERAPVGSPLRARADRPPRPRRELPQTGEIDARQYARRFAQLKAIVNGFLRASSATAEERQTLGWISTTSGSSRDPNIRQLYERALSQYNTAKQRRAERLGRRVSSVRSFGREGRMYQKSYGPGWFVKSKDGDIRRKEIVRHKIAAIKGARKRKLRRR